MYTETRSFWSRSASNGMKMHELRQKSKEELEAMILEKRTRLEELRYLIQQKKVKNVREGAALRKDIARILTLIRPTLNAKR